MIAGKEGTVRRDSGGLEGGGSQLHVWPQQSSPPRHFLAFLNTYQLTRNAPDTYRTAATHPYNKRTCAYGADATSFSFTWLRWYSMMTISCLTMRGLGPGGTIGSSSWNISNLSFLVCSALVMDLLLLLEFLSLDSSEPSVTNTTTYAYSSSSSSRWSEEEEEEEEEEERVVRR